MVEICLPTTAATGIEQERIATPSTCTVQAPHWAMPQPYLVPVMPSVSRSTQSNGVESSTSALCDWPLMDSEIIQVLPFGHRAKIVRCGKSMGCGAPLPGSIALAVAE